MNDLNLVGIYDKRTLKMAKELGVSAFEFDFRPKSSNFLQKRVLNELLKEIEIEQVYFHFQGEPDFMVKDILECAQENGVKPILVFSDIRDVSYYESFKTPYIWSWEPAEQASKIISGKNCVGVTFNYILLRDVLKTGNIQNFITNFYSSNKDFLAKNKLIGLEIKWGENLAPSVANILDYNFIRVQISSDVEVCYRNVDSNKLKQNVEYFSKIL